MEYFCGLDVGMDETAVCVVDDKGKAMLETTVVTDPEAIKVALKPYLGRLRRAGHEAGSLSPWLHPELLRLGLPAVCLETHHVRAALKAQRNKTDKADALGIAHIMRTGWYRQAHIKTEACYRLRLLLTHRRNLKRKFLDLENAIRHSLKAFGIRHPAQRHRSRRLCAGRARGGRIRCADHRADGCDAERPRGAVEGVLPAARSGGQICCWP
jgi:transposase